MVHPIPKAPTCCFADNDLVELETLDNMGTMQATERSITVGVGNTVRLFEITAHGATEVLAYDELPAIYNPMPTQLVADFEDDLGVVPDNLEGMTAGPTFLFY